MRRKFRMEGMCGEGGRVRGKGGWEGRFFFGGVEGEGREGFFLGVFFFWGGFFWGFF